MGAGWRGGVCLAAEGGQRRGKGQLCVCVCVGERFGGSCKEAERNGGQCQGRGQV